MRAILLTALLCLGGCGIANGVGPLLAGGDGPAPEPTENAPCSNALCDCRGPGCSCTDDTCTCVGSECAIDTSSGGFGCTGSCECDLSSCTCTDVDCEAVGAGQVCPGETCECGNGGCTN